MIKLYLYARRYLSLMLVCCSLGAFAQQTVTGKVTSSDDGSAIPGVNILEKGTTNGTVSDADGNFSISTGANSTLVFSFVGYASQEVPVGGQTSLSVKLISDVTALSEVVVIGYGSQDKKEITGSVTTVDTKAFNKGNVNDPTQLLQGKVAGLSIYNKGSDPNQAATIRLRGLSSFGANSAPLIVVDGVLGATLDNIDPNDIESINVLKDGSAAAIYGSRGSTGVILVTTKRGAKKGGAKIEFNSYVAAASIYKKIPVMSPDQYVAAGGNNLGAKTDWQDLVSQTGITTVNNLSISGGNENTTYRMSANVRNVSGILKTSGWDQINTRANVTHSALDGKLRVDANMSVTNRNINYAYPAAFRYASLYNPTAPVYFPNGSYYQAILFDNFNPVAILNQNTKTGVSRNINLGAKIDYQITNNLTATVNFGQQYTTLSTDEYSLSTSLYNNGFNRNGFATRYESQDNFTLFETYLSYNKSFNKIDLTATGGYSYQEQQFKDLYVQTGNFPNDLLGSNQLQNSGDFLTGITGGNGINITSSKTPLNKIIAGFLRVNVMFDKAIYFNASIRQEGSTKLGTSNQWGSFVSFGAGVDLNKYLQLDNVSQLKFRAAYGVTGSLPPSGGLSKPYYGYSNSSGGAISLLTVPNSNLKWEQKAETDLGIDFGLMNGKITGSMDVYSRDITNTFLYRRLDAAGNNGSNPYQWQNAGSLNTKGIELSINYNDLQIGEVKWTPGLVISSYNTDLTSFILPKAAYNDFGAPGQNGTYITRLDVGQSIGQIWGPVFDHVSQGGTDGANQTTGGVKAGAPVFKDLNGDGKIDSQPSDILISPDQKKLGSGIPSAEIGWSNRVTYKNWDLNVFFRAAFGHSLVNQFRAFYEPVDPGAINSYNRVVTNKAVAGLTSAQYSSLYVEKADFFRLDNMTIGYTFKMKSGSAVKNLRLYGSGQNLFIITSYTGIDPDPSLTDPESTGFESVIGAGIDRRSNYFTARTFTFGLNIGF